MRALVVVALLATDAGAQTYPGVRDDAAEWLSIVPSVVDVPVGVSIEGLAVRGGTGADTAILVDGFEIPRLSHFLGLRSVIPIQMLGDGTLKTAPDVGIGRAPTAVSLVTETRVRHYEYEANTFDVAARERLRGFDLGARLSVLDAVTDTTYRDLQAQVDVPLGKRLAVHASTIWSDDESTRDDVTGATFGRTTVALAHTGQRWVTSLALSSLVASEHIDRGGAAHHDAMQVTLDARAEAMRTVPMIAGLTRLEWRLGGETTNARHDIDVAEPLLPREGSPQPSHPGPDDIATRFAKMFWTSDLAVWTSVAANLSARLRATTGLRIDYFTRGHDVAIQPRAELYGDPAPRWRIGIAAGAYRRPPEHGDELYTDQLNPERSTQVMARVEHEHQALRVQGNAYYIDRRRLIIRDADGVLRNTGMGTSYGLELSAQLKIRKWFSLAGVSLSRSLRRDFLRGLERPAEFDQPLRGNVIVTRRVGPWTFGGRLLVASGLPTTAIQGTIYDADGDSYKPIFARTYAERLPFRYEVVARVDRAITLGRSMRLYAYVDLQLSTSTLGYEDSFDYRRRSAITVPVLPYAGLRGTL